MESSFQFTFNEKIGDVVLGGLQGELIWKYKKKSILKVLLKYWKLFRGGCTWKK